MDAKERKGDPYLSSAILRVLGGQISLFSFFVVVYQPLDAESQVRNVKVYQEPDFEPTQLQVCEELSMVNTQKLFNDLQFHDDDLFDEQVDPIPDIQLNPFIGNGKWHFLANAESTQVPFVSQTCSIRAL